MVRRFHFLRGFVSWLTSGDKHGRTESQGISDSCGIVIRAMVKEGGPYNPALAVIIHYEQSGQHILLKEYIRAIPKTRLL